MGSHQEDFNTALKNLREDFKEHRAETRQDIKEVETKTDAWQEEVRAKFKEVKTRLTTIEIRIATRDDVKKVGWDRVLSIAAIVIASIAAWIHYIKN